jgi:hypothetical protein
MNCLTFVQVENVAEAIYKRHWRAPSPVWENASDNVKSFVREQAIAAIHSYEAHSDLVRRTAND